MHAPQQGIYSRDTCLLLFFSACVVVALLAGCSGREVEDDARAAEGGQAFSIYLAEDSALRAYDHDQTDLDSLELRDEPLLTEEDISAYSWKEHAFTLAEVSEVVFPRPGVYGIPFVIMSQNERHYLGGLWTMISSVAYVEPVIYVDAMASSRTYVIEWGYPAGAHGAGEDPRENPTIKEALRSAGKLLP